MKKYIIIIFISFVLVPLTANGQLKDEPTISVSPGTFEMDVLGGEILDKEIIIQNYSKLALPIKIKTLSFDASDETGGMNFFYDTADSNTSAEGWLKAARPEFILDPGEQIRLPIKINIPSEALPGGHYVTMLFEPQLPSFYVPDGSTHILPVVGVLFLINVQKDSLFTGSNKDWLAITSFDFNQFGKLAWQGLGKWFEKTVALFFPRQAVASIPPWLYDSAPRDFIMRIKNNQLFHVKPYGEVTVHNIFSRELISYQVKQFTILPNRTRQLSIPLEWNKQTSFIPAELGRYVVTLSLQTTDGYKLNEQYVLWILPWHFMLSTILVFGIFIYFVVKYRQRISMAVRVLFSKN
jgi:hypothetical protein